MDRTALTHWKSVYPRLCNMGQFPTCMKELKNNLGWKYLTTISDTERSKTDWLRSDFPFVPHSGMFRALVLNINFNSLQLAFRYERIRLQLRWALIFRNLAPKSLQNRRRWWGVEWKKRVKITGDVGSYFQALVFSNRGSLRWRGGNYLFNSLSLKYSVITRAIEPPTVHLSLMQILRGFSTSLDGKESVWYQEIQVWSLGQEDPLKTGMATHSSIHDWIIPWTEEPVRT